MRFRSLAAALILLAPVLARAQTAPINPANLPSPLPTKGITDTGGINTTSTSGFQQNGVTVLSVTPTGTNIAIGGSGYASKTTATYNFYAGPGPLAPLITTAHDNVVIGQAAGASIVDCGGSSGYDTAIGFNSLNQDIGCENTGVGSNTLARNTTGIFNVGIGNDAGANITTGSSNIMMGHGAGGNNSAVAAVTGSGNTSLGDSAAGSLSGAANSNVYVGAKAGNGTTVAPNKGSTNVGIGQVLLNISTASNNVAIGNVAIGGTTSAPLTRWLQCRGWEWCTGCDPGFWLVGMSRLGNNAGHAITTGNSSVFVGSNAGSAATGSGNTFLGANVGSTVTTGSQDTLIGNKRNIAGTPTVTTGNYLGLCAGAGPLFE